MITSALLIVLFTAALAGLVLLKRIFATNIVKATFQRDAAVIMNIVIEGKGNPNGVRLSEAKTVDFYNDAITGFTIKFKGADDPITGVNAFYQKYYLGVDNDGRTILCYSDDNGVSNKTMYTAPKGAVVTLKNVFTLNIDYVIIHVGVSQTIDGRTVLGTLESSVYLRNHIVYS